MYQYIEKNPLYAIFTSEKKWLHYIEESNTMKITAIVTGTIETWLHLLSRPLVRDNGIRISVPVACYLLEHNGKKLLFDAGQTVPERKQETLANYFVKVTTEETAAQQLKNSGINPDSVDYIILSHAHADHCNGLKHFPCAKVIAQTQTADALRHFNNEFTSIDGKHDVLGDGSIVCIPTPGHAPGHQSLLVTCDDGNQILLIGDAVYMPEALEYEPSAQEQREKPDFFNSLKLLRSLQNEGVKLCFGHYPYSFIN